MTNESPNHVAPRDHFANLAANWSHIGPPLRPSPDDTAAVQRAVDRLADGARAVALGLTPEIIACDWPQGVRLTALDHSPKMITALWPPARGPANAQAVLGDWCTMPVASNTVDFIAGDGCYVLLAYPDGYENLTKSAWRALRPGGQLVMRVFLRPNQPESVTDIAHALAMGAIGSVHVLKLRLLAAVHGLSGAGSRLDDVWRAWKSMPPLPASRVNLNGWTADEIAGIDAYRGVQARYFLPTLDEFRQSTLVYFDEIECSFARYELGERCPTFVFSRREARRTA